VAGAALLFSVITAQAQSADVVLMNGKIVTLNSQSSIAQALAIRDGRILAVGNNEDIQKLAGGQTHRIDLGNRTVIPGLIDAHIHAVRAGLDAAMVLDWDGVTTVHDALETIRKEAQRLQPGQWIRIVGNWNKDQFSERRAPTPKELEQVAPDNPVYVQHLYDFAVLNPAAVKALNITAQSEFPPAGKVVVDQHGQPTGVIEASSSPPTMAGLYARLPKPTFADQVNGTKVFFRTLNRLGITGIIDEGGSGLPAANYQPLFTVWHSGDLSARVRFNLMSQKSGQELADLKTITQMLPPRFGDDMLRFLGIGEVPIWKTHDGALGALARKNPFNPSPEAKTDLLDLASWAAQRNYPLHIHATTNHSASQILDIFEQVNKTTPIAGLRWQIAHVEDITDESLRRMKELGVSWGVEDRLYYGSDTLIKSLDEKNVRRMPPIVTAMQMGILVSGGTDALAVGPYNPFISLYWELTGKNVSGTSTRAPEEIPTRINALKTYTLNGAWVSFEENERGSLEVGKHADFAVLDRDYLTIPVENIPATTSLLTVVGGHAVFADGSLKEWEREF
jgi:predicted amidohydrolase YtcJ